MCRYGRVVVLANVIIIDKHSKGLKSKCPYRQIVALAGVLLAGFNCTFPSDLSTRKRKNFKMVSYGFTVTDTTWYSL